MSTDRKRYIALSLVTSTHQPQPAAKPRPASLTQCRRAAMTVVVLPVSPRKFVHPQQPQAGTESSDDDAGEEHKNDSDVERGGIRTNTHSDDRTSEQHTVTPQNTTQHYTSKHVTRRIARTFCGQADWVGLIRLRSMRLVALLWVALVASAAAVDLWLNMWTLL